MIDADILISSGSSFAAVAAELSSSRQIVLMFPAKEGAVATKAYNRGDALDIDGNGIVNQQERFEALLDDKQAALARADGTKIRWQDVKLVGPLPEGLEKKIIDKKRWIHFLNTRDFGARVSRLSRAAERRANRVDHSIAGDNCST